MNEGGFESVSREEVLAWINKPGALDRARKEARRYADEATEALSIFPPSQYRQALLSIPRFIIERDM